MKNLTNYQKELKETIDKYIDYTFDRDKFIIDYNNIIGICAEMIDIDKVKIRVYSMEPNKVDVYIESIFVGTYILKYNNLWMSFTGGNIKYRK